MQDLTPLAAEEFAALLAPFLPLPPRAAVAVAVSGGPDSMALAFCLKRSGLADPLALIVDHALRPESAAEAEQARARLAALGVAGEILRWDHEPVKNRLHEQARAARYALLLSACRARGIGALFLAHHRDDQAETVLMRLSKGSGIDGLAGMAAESAREDIRLLRPFLSVPKTRLVATCDSAGIPFVADPSNAAPQFARGRLRAVMPLLEREGFGADSLIAVGEQAAEAAAALSFYAQELLRAHAERNAGGDIYIPRDALREVPRAVALRALSSCLRALHRGPHAPARASINALLDAVCAPGPLKARNIHGCLLAACGDRLHILREPAAVIESIPLRGGQSAVWDGRWRVVWEANAAETATLRALGNPPHETLDLLSPGLRRAVPQGRVRASLPALWRENALVAAPAFNAGPLHVAPLKQAFP